MFGTPILAPGGAIELDGLSQSCRSIGLATYRCRTVTPRVGFLT
jgi:hypothetical protein